MSCVERAKAGHLMDDLPTELSGFAVAPLERGAHLTRTGRVLTTAEGTALWQALRNEVFTAGVANAHIGMTSVYKCAGVGDASCIKVDQSACQITLDALAQGIARAIDTLGLADAELDVVTTFKEARGPSCKAGPGCAPVQHYSTKGTYDPNAPRKGDHDGRGACADDGDCEGANSNVCSAWYLRGGLELLVYTRYGTPIWCGCVHERCSWFSQ